MNTKSKYSILYQIEKWLAENKYPNSVSKLHILAILEALNSLNLLDLKNIDNSYQMEFFEPTQS